MVSQIAPGVFAGRKPRSQSDFETLRRHGIHTIVNMQTMTWDIEPERKLAARNGIEYRNIPIVASPFGPPERKVQQLFQTIAEPSLQPVYVHCLLGRDRTAVLMALYRVYYQNCSPEVAWKEMIDRGGFRSRWALVGFKNYYWNHSQKPTWVTETLPVENKQPPSIAQSDVTPRSAKSTSPRVTLIGRTTSTANP